MSENHSSTTSESSDDSLSSLNISADTSGSDDNRSLNQEDELLLIGNVQGYRFEPQYHSDSESENGDAAAIGLTEEEAEQRRTTTNWYEI